MLLGIHYHGFGNWEKIRLDERLGLAKKIAPVELQHHETFLPRAPNLKDRANALLEMVGNLCNQSVYMWLELLLSVFAKYTRVKSVGKIPPLGCKYDCIALA